MLRRVLTLAAASLLITPALAQSPKVGDPPEASNMRLVGMNDLQARSRLSADHPPAGRPLHRLYRPPWRHA